MDTSQVFGVKNKFAIHYQPCPDTYNYTPAAKMAICHLSIGDNFIGDAGVESYLPTWLFSLTDRKNRIADTKHLLFPKEFEGLSDREIFETILRPNQFEDEFHPDFIFLPKLDNKFWVSHNFTLDETIDGYLIYFYVKDNQITFLIEDETDILDNNNRNYQFIFHSLDVDLFISTVDVTVRFLLQQYPYLKDDISSRRFPLLL